MADVRTLYHGGSSLKRTQDGDNHLVDGLKPASGSAITLNNFPITNLADPTNLQDAATRAFSVRYWKIPARAATTAAITLSGTQTVDGVALIAGDVCLVKNQGGTASNSANGPYTVAAGAWARRTDSSVSAQVPSGLMITVAEGTVNGSTFWMLTTAAPITLGTTPLAFGKAGGVGFGLLQSVFAEVTSDTTTTSGTWVDLITQSVTTSGKDLLVNLSASFTGSNANALIQFRVLIDGASTRGTGETTGGGAHQASASMLVKKSVSAGAHTVKMQWQVSNGTAQVRPVAAADAEHASLLIQEVS